MSAALTTYEESLCPGCGQPKDRAYGEESDGWYTLRSIVCDPCAAIQEDRSEDLGAKRERQPGEKVWAVDGRLAAHDAGH